MKVKLVKINFYDLKANCILRGHNDTCISAFVEKDKGSPTSKCTFRKCPFVKDAINKTKKED